MTKTKPETLWVEFEAEERNTLSLEGEMDEENSCGDFDTVMYSIKRKFGAGLDDNSPVFICKKHLGKLRAAQPRKYDRCENCKDEKVVSGLCEICQSSRDARKIAEGMAQGKKELLDEWDKELSNKGFHTDSFIRHEIRAKFKEAQKEGTK